MDIEMNYKLHYDILILRSLNREILVGEYYENHHIIPKCLNGPDTINNLVKLTAREHYIAHALLAKIYSNTPDGYKLASAFLYMSTDSHGGRRSKNKKYEWARKLFAKNHPCKQQHIKDKISKSLISGIKNGTIIPKSIPKETRICLCGCGTEFITSINSKKKYVPTHRSKVPYTEIEKQEQSIRLKNYIGGLSEEARVIRIKNSFGGCDQIARGKAISLAKKGKKTNQSNMEIEKYGKMSEEEFSNHIKNFPKNIKTRCTNRRNIYFERINNK